MPVTVRLPAIAAPFVEWPWPGNADAAEAALLDRSMREHSWACSYCQSHPSPPRPGGWIMGCGWAAYINAARIRTASRGEGGETVPVILGVPAA